MNEKEYILTRLLNCSRTGLYAENAILDDNTQKELSAILLRRKQGIPLQYILGDMEFMGLKFKVDERALIPRPETEILAEEAVRSCQLSVVSCQRILDIGTGCGNIAVSLARNLPELEIIALDISPEAIELARENAALNNVAGRIDFMVSDLFNNIAADEKFDMIISNPPYVPAGEIENLSPEVKSEPRLALDGGADGLDFYRRIIPASRSHLKKDGLILLEIGYNQRKAVRGLFGNYPDFKIIRIIPDYRGIERVVIAKRI